MELPGGLECAIRALHLSRPRPRLRITQFNFHAGARKGCGISAAGPVLTDPPVPAADRFSRLRFSQYAQDLSRAVMELSREIKLQKPRRCAVNAQHSTRR